MSVWQDVELRRLFLGIAVVLLVASFVGQVLAWRGRRRGGVSGTVANLNSRVNAWWVMCAIFLAALLSGTAGALILYGLISVLALREFLTLTPTGPDDHAALVWVFFFFTPLQYVLVGMRWYGLFAILIPVYAFLLLPALMVMGGQTKGFMERAATLQWGLLTCVYCLSYAPALLALELDDFTGQGAKLLLFLFVVVQGSDVSQYIFGKLFGRHPIAPRVSPNKTVEGFIGGGLLATGLAAALFWITPFSPLQAAGFGAIIVITGFFGGLVMSAIKRDRGVKDFGTLIRGHGGIMDRFDSVVFAAPVFFHLSRFFFGADGTF
jgi:phosphatidate cytidylyltransferase